MNAKCRRIAALSVILPAGLAVSGALSQAASTSAGPVSVPLSIRGAQGTAGGATPVIKVKVGNGPTVPVVLDTGSVGLHIYAPGVKRGSGSGVTVTTRKNSIAYVDGTQQSGVVATAKITIGGCRNHYAANPVWFDHQRRLCVE